MKNTGIFAVLVLMLLIAPLSSAQWFLTADEARSRLEISGGAQVVKETSRARLDSVSVNLSLFPKDFEWQEVERIDFTPDAQIKGDSALFSFGLGDDIAFRVDSVVRTHNAEPQIPHKIAFPIEDIPDEIEQYLLATDIIDADDSDIRRLASQLVEGEDDLYAAVYEIAKWTRENVQYNLSTVTADVSQKASWVLAERKGVCDEITSLFIAMLRSVGIPARFVTGYAYTNSPLFPDGWGAHGWAEVYFPSIGWVPFDVTYGQFGSIDSGHIKMVDSIDADSSSTRYEWKGRDVTLDLKELEYDVSLIDYDGKVESGLEIEVIALKDEIRFGSYNAIEARIKNTQTSYLMTEVSLSAPKEVRIEGHTRKDVLLRPLEEKSVYWVVELSDDLNSEFIYTFPLSVQYGRNESSDGAFMAQKRAQLLTLEEVGAILDLREEEQEKSYSAALEMECDASTEEFYWDEKENITCTLRNTGNLNLRALRICADTCDVLDLSISQREEIAFEIDTDAIGKRDIVVSAKNMQVTKSVNVPIEILDNPALSIEAAVGSEGMKYEESRRFTMTLKKESYSQPKDVVVLTTINAKTFEWNIPVLESDSELMFDLKGSNLFEGENELRITATYRDERNNTQESSIEKTLVLSDVTFVQKMVLFAKKVGLSVGSLFS